MQGASPSDVGRCDASQRLEEDGPGVSGDGNSITWCKGAEMREEKEEPRAAVSPSVCASLWSYFDEQYGNALLTHGADKLSHDAMADLQLQLQLSRSQISRQFDRWRIARRDSGKAHEHSASLHAHRRRAFGADDTLYNRLRTIVHDANFVGRVSTRFPGWPLVANLRCGAWYAPPEAFAATVRFKSTGEVVPLHDWRR